ncbi:MAG: metal ABC transporter solute-binding protein, Zn/Mn family [Gemmataceae bacterium]
MLGSTTIARLGLLLLTVMVGICGCERSSERTDARLRIVVTTTILADAVRTIGGEDIHLEVLMGPGVDPHRYTPTAGDSGRLADAQLIFFHGLHLEGKMIDVLEKPGRPAIAVSQQVPQDQLRQVDGEAVPDPHLWMNPRLWRQCLAIIPKELSKLAPEKQALFEQRATTYFAAIDAADADAEKWLTDVPLAQRVLVTSHDAFAYFGERYRYQVRGLQGVSTAAEISFTDRKELAAFLSKQKLRAVFTESSVPPKGLSAVLETVRNDTGHEVKLVGGDDALYSDSLGPSGSPAASYPSMIRHNAKTIADALR